MANKSNLAFNEDDREEFKNYKQTLDDLLDSHVVCIGDKYYNVHLDVTFRYDGNLWVLERPCFNSEPDES